MEKTKTKKIDFIEIEFTGYANGQVFDSNIEEDIKALDSKQKPKKTIVAIGEAMVVKGLDKALEDKELEKEYEINLKSNEAFGERKRELIRTLPLKSFTDQKVNPQAGMMLTLDNSLVKILTVSGARVITDFNNPLSGKEIKYKFKITRLVTDEKEKAEALFDFFLHFTPESEIKDNKIIIKGPKPLEGIIPMFNEKFKEILGKELAFELKEPKEVSSPQGVEEARGSSSKSESDSTEKPKEETKPEEKHSEE